MHGATMKMILFGWFLLVLIGDNKKHNQFVIYVSYAAVNICHEKCVSNVTAVSIRLVFLCF